MQPVRSLDDFRKYLDGVQAKHPDYVASVVGSGGITRLGLPEENGRKDIRLATTVTNSFTGGIPFSVALSADGKKVLGAATIGDPESEFAKFPAPFNTHDSIYGHFATRLEFRKYNNKDPLSGQAVQALDPIKRCNRCATLTFY